MKSGFRDYRVWTDLSFPGHVLYRVR